jgi:hypothetical protein
VFERAKTFHALDGAATLISKEISTLWDITPRNPVKVKGRFVGKCCFNPQDRRVSQARNLTELYMLSAL